MKSIDFDQVCEFYDLYVHATYDIPFWTQVVASTKPPRLELMCGTGRITVPILRGGDDLEGLDYSEGLLQVLRKKLTSMGLSTALHHADARALSLPRKYGLIFIGFQSVSEIVLNSDKQTVFERVRDHMTNEGQFWVTTHNPNIRRSFYDGRVIDLGRYTLPETGEEIQVSGSYRMEESTGICTGVQRFRCTREGRVTREVEQPLRFHVIAPPTLEELLEQAGLRAEERFGDYDRSPFDPEQSPYFIVRSRSC